MTGKTSRARQTGQDIPQEPEALLGWLGSWGFLWAWQGVRGPHRVPQQPLPYQRQGGRRLEWPPRPQQEEPRLDKTWLKCSCGHKTQTRLSWPWRVDWIHRARVSGGRWAWVSGDPAGLSQRRSGGLESAAIRRAWVSGDPAGLSQRRFGGLESAATRRAWVRDGPAGIISRERRAWGSGNPGTREPAGGLGIATASDGYLPRSAGMRARGQRTCLPRETKHRNKNNN